jgi:hypothetical protein
MNRTFDFLMWADWFLGYEDPIAFLTAFSTVCSAWTSRRRRPSHWRSGGCPDSGSFSAGRSSGSARTRPPYRPGRMVQHAAALELRAPDPGWRIGDRAQRHRPAWRRPGPEVHAHGTATATGSPQLVVLWLATTAAGPSGTNQPNHSRAATHGGSSPGENPEAAGGRSAQTRAAKGPQTSADERFEPILTTMLTGELTPQ